MTTQYITIRAHAFTGEGIRAQRVSVDDDGTIRVYDSVAGYYTTCHSLSASAQRRIRALDP